MFSRKSALQIAVTDLEKAQQDLLSHAFQREHWTAMEAMVRERVVRLQGDVERLKADSGVKSDAYTKALVDPMAETHLRAIG